MPEVAVRSAATLLITVGGGTSPLAAPPASRDPSASDLRQRSGLTGLFRDI
ncbi:hypothetical protein AB0C98_34380 [Streptomyces sp. NPDC048558]|uniref:hypothetical protein n=1 Tax=Streptomyces sp. NPDC048558 TaxID=3155759 RepID=UPI0034304A34